MKRGKIFDLVVVIIVAIASILFLIWRIGFDDHMTTITEETIHLQTEQGKANYEADLEEIKAWITVQPIITMDAMSEMFEPKMKKEFKEETCIILTEYEFNYLCCMVESEAGNQGLLGKQYAADVAINRMLEEGYGDTIPEVINSTGQFAVVSTGFINVVEVSEETIKAVTMELENRLNDKIIYFQRYDYRTDRPQAFQYMDHYFSY